MTLADYKITSSDLKLALLQYFRFKRGWVCVDEFRGADIIVDTGKEIIEVEVKMTRSDLISGERRKKSKHWAYKMGYSYMRNRPNKFIFCVPSRLVKIALSWSKELNPKYGVMSFDVNLFNKWNEIGVFGKRGTQHFDCLVYRRSAKPLHDGYDNKLRYAIAKRASSKLTGLLEKRFMEQSK